MGHTRQVRAGAFGVPALVLLTLCLAAASVANAAAFATEAAEATGDIHFQVDGVRLLSADGGEEAHVFIGIFDDEVRCESLEGREGPWIWLDTRLDLLRRGELPPVRQSLDLYVPCVDRAGDVAFSRRMVNLQVPLPPDVEAFELEIQDHRALREGLLYRIHAEHKRGLARAYLPPVQVLEGRGMGGPLFCWASNPPRSFRSQEGFIIGEATELRDRMEANPTRAYGLFNPTVTLYAEAYHLDGGPRELELRVFMLADSLELVRELVQVTIPVPHAGLLREVDVSSLAAGSYGLTLRIGAAGELEPAGGFEVTGRFEVHWDPDAWQKSAHQRNEEASLLLDDEAFQAFLHLDPGHQEAHLDSLWQGSGEGAVDGLKRLFRDRVAVADQRFGAGGRGCLTDRGKTFIRFGEPDEVHKELLPQDEDQLFYFLGREIDDNEAVEMGGRPLRHPLDNSSYQVWYYTNRGDPLFREWGMMGSGGSLRFVFVDEVGDGTYQLVYTNLLGGVD